MDKTGVKLLIFVQKYYKRELRGETWSRGTNSRLPFGENISAENTNKMKVMKKTGNKK